MKECLNAEGVNSDYIVVGTAGEAVGQGSYDDKEELVHVVISDGVTEIYPSAFEECVNLESVVIPKSVREIGDDAFKGCVRLKTVDMKATVKSLCRTFVDCTGLERVDLPEGLEHIDGCTFARCCGLKSLVLPSSLDSISSNTEENYFTSSEGAFLDCIGLRRVEFKSGQVSIAHGAFRNCSLLQEIVLPEGIDQSARIFHSLGYKEIASIVEENSDLPKDMPSHLVKITLPWESLRGWVNWADSLDEIDDDFSEEPKGIDLFNDFLAMYEWSPLSAEIDGEPVELRSEDLEIGVACSGSINTWEDFRVGTGVYVMERWLEEVTIAFVALGDFDPSKITLHYKLAAALGYDEFRTNSVAILDYMEYEGRRGSFISFGSDSDNEEIVTIVFNNGKYSYYGHDKWRPIPESHRC